jgi:hypothetical protein
MNIDTNLGSKYHLTVPCKGCKSLDKLLAAGKYDWISPDVTDEHFPLKQKGTVQVSVLPVVLGCGHYVDNTDALVQLATRGLRPATIDHLLTFGATFPDEQRKYPIVALGSVSRIHDHSCIPFLAAAGTSRFIGVLAWDDEWSNAMRFLALKE